MKRRQFLATTATGSMVVPHIVTAANEKKLKAGIIGVGWYGMVDAKAALKVGNTEIAAICDVDSANLAKSSDELNGLQGSRPKTFKHYQELLDMDGLDYIIIATPPHWHAMTFIAACKKGYPIYCEKPLAYDIREGRAMVNAAKAAGNIVQIGFQRRQSKAFQEVKDYIASGKAGNIVQVDAQIIYTAGVRDNTPQNPPDTLDWDLWCGPAPKLPYSPNIGHFAWRLEKQYGNGHLVDWGIHLIDATRMILDLDMPNTITSDGGIYRLKDQITTPDTMTVWFDFERCPVVWKHRLWGSAEYTPEINNGIVLFGEKATIYAGDNRWEVIPNERNAERQKHEASSDMGTSQMADFLTAVREGKQPSCQPIDGFQSTATVQLGMIALEAEEKLHWDAKNELTHSRYANRLLKRQYRKPYEHPFVG